MKLTALFVALLAAATASTQEPKSYRVAFAANSSIPATIHFFCSQGYEKQECMHDVAALWRALAPYPLRLLGEWLFYLALARERRPLAHSHSGPSFSQHFRCCSAEQPSWIVACFPVRSTATLSLKSGRVSL